MAITGKWQRFLKIVKPEQFEEIAITFGDWLTIDLLSLDEGTHEIQLRSGIVTVAAKPADQFLAFRGCFQGLILEGFFTNPESTPARMSVSVLALDSYTLPTQISLLFSDSDLAETVPSFQVLSSLLNGNGFAVTQRSSEFLDLREEVTYLRQLMAEQSDELRRSRAELRALKQSLHGSPVSSDSAALSPLDHSWNLDNLAEWCADNETSIVVLPRARSGVKNSIYEKPDLIVAGLELLAGPYRHLRTGKISKADFDERLAESGLHLDGSVGISVAGEFREQYFVIWSGRRRLMDMHLAKGGGRDMRYSLRIYFFWDDASQRPVVCSMPAHLDNSLT